MNTPLLTADEEIVLALQIEAGLVAGEVLEAETTAVATDATHCELEILVAQGQAAWTMMWQSNVRLAWSLAIRAHRRFGGTLDDLSQEAQIGLAEALMRWDHTMGVKFSTYAWRWVGWRLERATRLERRARHQLSSIDGPPEQADESAETDMHAWVDRQLPGWLWSLDAADRELLVRRHGPEQASAEQLAQERQISATTLRRFERQAIERARRAALREQWATMAG